MLITILLLFIHYLFSNCHMYTLFILLFLLLLLLVVVVVVVVVVIVIESSLLMLTKPELVCQ